MIATYPRLRAALLVAVLALPGAALPADDATALLKRASAAMGADQLRTLHYFGKGTGAAFGQAWVPGKAWPKHNVHGFARSIDYEGAAMREEVTRSRAEPNGGSALPLAGEQRALQFVAGTVAWNMAGPAPVPAPHTATARIHDLWTTPHGVLKAAAKAGAGVEWRSVGGREFAVVSFTDPGRFKASVFINGDYLVERIESLVPNPVLGDTRTVTEFDGYRDHGGVRFPSRIRQSQGGFPVLDLEIGEVQPNTRVDVQVPEVARAGVQRVVTTPMAKGVWFVSGGSHNSVVIEMKDHLVLVESPLSDERATAVLQAAKNLAPGKPVRTVVNSHSHFDHAGGLRAAAAEGAAIVTHQASKAMLERAFASPNAINPDRLAISGRKARVTGVGDRHTITDGERTVDLHAIQGSIHAQGFLMVHLPREGLLVEGDAYTPGPPPAKPNANHLNLIDNIERLKLAVDRILPLHGNPVPLDDLYRAAGRKR